MRGPEIETEAAAKVTPRRRKLLLRTKLMFASGSLEEAMVGAAGITTMLFYNQVLGLSASLCGMVFLIASVIDGISDPIVGAASDRLQSRWGRRHPWMLASALPLAGAFYCLYQPPVGLSEAGLFWWFLSFMAVLRLAKTFYTVPHAALGAELTDDYHERTSVFGYTAVVGMAGGVLLGVLILVVLFPSTPHYGNGLLNATRYPLFAGFGAVIITVSVIVCTLGTRDQIPYLHRVESEQFDYRAYAREIWELLRNRSYISVCASWLVLSVSIGILNMVGTYTYIYAFELSTEQLTILRFVTLPGILLAIPCATWLTRWLDKKKTLILTCGACAILLGLPYTLRLLGWFPGNESSWLLVALFGPMLLAFLVAPVLPIVIDSQLVDVTDEHEFRTGKRSEGIVFSIRTFAMKATSGIGGLIGGFGLEFIHFPAHAKVGEVEPEVLDGLLFMCGPTYWLIVAASMGFMAMYQLNERRHQNILTVLEQRRAVAASQVA